MFFETNLILRLLRMRRNAVLKRLQEYLGIALAPETPGSGRYITIRATSVREILIY
jgi:hypothetical protein